MSSLYLFQKSEALPILESLNMIEGPSFRQLVSILPVVGPSSASSNSGRSPVEAFRLMLTNAAFCFSNHAQLLLGSPVDQPSKNGHLELPCASIFL